MRTKDIHTRRSAAVLSRWRLTSLPSLLSLVFGLALVLALLPSTAFAPVGGGVGGGVNLSGVGRATVTNIVQALMTSGGGSGVVTQTINNLTVVSNAYFQQDVIFNGKVTLNSNVTVNALNFKTNAAAVTTLNLGNNYQYLATNNNIAYTGFTGILAGETNVQWCTVIWTNTSGSLKTMTLAGTIGDATHYCTNQTALTVVRYPLAGTNVVSRPLN